MKLNTIILCILLLTACGGDVNVSAVSESKATTTSDSKSTSESAATSNSVSKLECDRCLTDPAAKDTAEALYDIVSRFINANPKIEVTVVNEIYTASMANLESGGDLDQIEIDLVNTLEKLKEVV